MRHRPAGAASPFAHRRDGWENLQIVATLVLVLGTALVGGSVARRFGRAAHHAHPGDEDRHGRRVIAA